MDRAGILLVGLAGLIYALSTAYIDINYMLMERERWEQIP
jgi:hypothetical protein